MVFNITPQLKKCILHIFVYFILECKFSFIAGDTKFVIRSYCEYR